MPTLLMLLALSGCSVAAPPQPAPPPPPPASPTSPTLALAGAPSMSEDFPLVKMEVHRSFAHDYGERVRLEKVTVDGVEVAADAVLAAIVAKRGGFTPSGGRSDAEVIATTTSFLEAWDGQLGIDRQTGAEPSEFLARAISSHPTIGPYHPPTVRIETIAGERVVVARQFAYSHTGRRGNVFHYMVRAFRVSDGVSVVLDGTPWLTQLMD